MAHQGRENPDSHELGPIADRLRRERPEADVLELDRIKLRAMAQAARRASARPRLGKGGLMRSRRVVSVALSLAVLSGGTAVWAASKPASSAPNGSAAESQYCPPSSQQPKKPKPPTTPPGGCGNPKTK
jgi:hypothetical protein